MKKLAYKILVEYNLILEYYQGEIVSEDVISLKEIESQDNLYNPGLNYIADFRELKTPFSSNGESGLKKVIEHYKKLELAGKVAVITTLPNQVVFVEMMKKLSVNDLRIRTEPFSTLEAAIEYVGCPAQADKIIKKTLEELKKVSGKR